MYLLLMGFALSAATEAQTKGIWIMVRKHPKQRKYFILLDSEGLGDADKVLI